MERKSLFEKGIFNSISPIRNFQFRTWNPLLREVLAVFLRSERRKSAIWMRERKWKRKYILIQIDIVLSSLFIRINSVVKEFIDWLVRLSHNAEQSLVNAGDLWCFLFLESFKTFRVSAHQHGLTSLISMNTQVLTVEGVWWATHFRDDISAGHWHQWRRLKFTLEPQHERGFCGMFFLGVERIGD